MIRYFLLFLLSFPALAQVPGQSQALAALVAPDSLRQGANSVVVSYDTEFEVTSPSSAVLHYRKVVTLLNGNHGGENVLSDFYTDDAKITSFEISTFDALGKETFKARKSDIQDRRYNDNMTFLQDIWIKTVDAPCATYPCTVVTEVSKKLSDYYAVNGLSSWSPVRREQSLLSASLKVTVPGNNELLYEPRQIGEPTRTRDDKVITYEWTLDHVPAQPAEPLAPPVSETLPYVRTELADFEIDGYRGSFRSWRDYGEFRREIMKDRSALPSTLAAEVHETVEGVADEREKIDRLYRLMQQRCRYVGIQIGLGGWQPFSAEYVERNRYGDCKALSNYMYAMLQEVGIEAYPVTIMWDDAPDYSPHGNFATSASNHMVLYVPSQDMYLECTSNNAPTGYLGEGKQDRMVMWITPEGGKLVRTPALVPSEHGHVRTVTMGINKDEVAYRLDATYFGASQEDFRQFGAHVGSTRDQLDRLHRGGILPDVSGTDYHFETVADRPEVSVGYATVLSNRVRKLGSRRFFAVNPHPIDWAPERNEERQLPAVYRNSRFYVDTVKVSYPPDMEIESGLFTEPLVYSHAAGEYRSVMKPAEDGIYWIRTLRLQPTTVPASEYTAFYEFFANVAKADNPQLVFRERRTK